MLYNNRFGRARSGPKFIKVHHIIKPIKLQIEFAPLA